jgi:hypothetical protein
MPFPLSVMKFILRRFAAPLLTTMNFESDSDLLTVGGVGHNPRQQQIFIKKIANFDAF